MCTAALASLAGTLLFAASAPAPNTPARALLDVSATVDLGEDLGQNFGSLFEATDPQGRVVAGAGFLGLYNTMFRADRHTLHAFVRPPEGNDVPTRAPLPRYSNDTGVYIGDVDGRLCALGKGRDRRIYLWNAAAGEWEVAPALGEGAPWDGDGQTRLGKRVLTFLNGRVMLDGKSVLEPPEVGTYHHFYYAQGHLFFYHNPADAAGTPTRLVACPWRPGEGEVDLKRAVVQPLSVAGETTWAYGQLKNYVLTVTNRGGVHRFDGKSWKALRLPDGTSYQVYAMLNYYDRLLLGHYPSGSVYEFDGEAVTARANFPPPMPGVAGYAREAQSLALYRGELFAGVWPWAEVWRLAPGSTQWSFVGRLFTRPPVTDQVGHPFEAEVKAYNAANNANMVINEWGQRATSMASADGALYVATANKGGTPRPPDLGFPDDALLQEYGRIHRLTLPGHLSGPIRWTGAPIRFRFLVTPDWAQLFQDGREIASAPVTPALAAGLRGAKVTWGRGVYGPFVGKVLSP
ncbi:MAG: hypothetical protein QHJ73_12045 [Armatimonadota bacterium]|nr:hypothetical protein [Armatimonadota bacterium]